MGLAYAKGPSIFYSPKFNQAWFPLSNTAIIDLHQLVVAHFKNLPYGPYDACVLILGTDRAAALAKEEQVKGRFLTKRRDNSDNNEGPSKRIRLP